MRDFTTFVRRHLEHLELPRHRELQIVEELAAQLEDAYDALVARGLSDEEAWRELQRGLPEWQSFAAQVLDAESAFVRVAQPAHERRSWLGTVLAALRQHPLQGLTGDLRAAVQLLFKDRGFSATTIVTLAVCLGANIAIFTVVYAVLLRPLPVPDAGRIVAFGDVYPTVTPNDIVSNTVPSYFDRLAALTALDEQAMFTYWYDTLPIDGVAQELRGLRATPSLFRVLRVQPVLGRTFTDAEGEAGSDRKIILSHGLWQRLFGGDPAVVGKDVRLGWTGQPYTIVGVMPPGFSFLEMVNDGHRTAGDGVQFWLPLAFTAAQRSDEARTRYGFFHIGRLKDGATIEQVRAQVDALNRRMFARYAQYRFIELRVYTAVTLLQDVLTGSVRRVLYLLWGGAGFVLLIGALNIANLSLARASTRGRELATRMALGAGRLRLTRQLIVEGVLLASIGGLAGFGAGAWLLRALIDGGLPDLPNAASIRIEPPVVACAIALTLLSGVLIGLVPAASLGRRDLQHALADASRSGTAGRSARLFRRGLIVTQVALSMVLLIGAGLLLTSFRNLLSTDVGFDGARVITGTVFAPPSRYPDQPAVVALADRLLESIRTIPGVEAAGVTSNIALSGHTSPSTVSAADRPSGATDAPVVPSVVAVSAGYFEAMGMRLIRGRYFAASDNARTLPVAIVDERLASRLWPTEDPIGKMLLRGSAVRYTVIGVVRDVAFESPAKRAESIGTAYFAHAQAPPMGRVRWVAVKTVAEPLTVVPLLRQTLAAIDRDLPLSDIQTMGQRAMGSVVSQKLAMTLATLFGAVALLLSAVGIYGVLAFVVARRTREIGVRMALGSSPRGIFRLVFGEGLVLVAGGVTLGLVGAFALRRVLEDQVFGVTPTDPAILAGVSVTTALVALLACTWPARRASRVDPLIVLKEQ